MCCIVTVSQPQQPQPATGASSSAAPSIQGASNTSTGQQPIAVLSGRHIVHLVTLKYGKVLGSNVIGKV